MLSKEYLSSKLEIELGRDYFTSIREFTPPFYSGTVREQVLPLGVLLHIAAGNAEGLPVFSVIEGLLTGNINILKLPGADDGVSGRLLIELIKIEPRLKEYIYVFDCPSTEIESIKKMADAADAIVVWGSDQAVSAVRHLAGTNTKIIEWGHKISFAYITKPVMNDVRELEALAHNICGTDQLLCNSCQAVCLDTDDMADVHQFCGTFIEILGRVSRLYPQRYDIGLNAQIALRLRNEEIEEIYGEKKLYKGSGCSLIASGGYGLEPALLFRNCIVRRLPRGQIIKTLKPLKSHLQTAALICEENERQPLSEVFSRTGIVRITKAQNMSVNYCGSPHDGEYPLRRYTRTVTFE